MRRNKLKTGDIVEYHSQTRMWYGVITKIGMRKVHINRMSMNGATCMSYLKAGFPPLGKDKVSANNVASVLGKTS